MEADFRLLRALSTHQETEGLYFLKRRFSKGHWEKELFFQAIFIKHLSCTELCAEPCEGYRGEQAMVAALKEFSIKHASSDAKNEGARLHKEIRKGRASRMSLYCRHNKP